MSVVSRRSFTAAKHIISKLNIKPSMRSLSTVNEYDYDANSVHFRNTATPHPLATDKDPKKAEQVFIKICFTRTKYLLYFYFFDDIKAAL